MVGQVGRREIANDARIYRQAAAAHDSDAPRRADADVRHHPARSRGSHRPAAGRSAGRHRRRNRRLLGAPRSRQEAGRGTEEALRLRQAARRALRRDAEELRAVRSRPQFHAQQGCLAADQGEAAGVDQPRPVDVPDLLPDLGAPGGGQGRARRRPVRHADHPRRPGGLCDSGLRARRAADRAVRGGNVSGLVSASRPRVRQLVRDELAAAGSSITCGIWSCRSSATRSAVSPS